MSTPYNRDPGDPLSLVSIDEALMDEVSSLGRGKPRKRMILRFHEHDEPLQRMLNAVEPESYVRPHRHLREHEAEMFVALRGSVLVVRFGDDGAPLEGVVAGAGGPVQGVEVPPGAWHCFIALQPGTVLFEVKRGPYDPATAKDFAPWAPPEEDVEAGQAFIAGVRRHFEPILPEVANLDRIQAEEKDIC
jgi:cupin fold WbuC family metalloprotein